ncbi:MAG: signal peptidase II [Clostridia bacterium]|nr:signal peptidase II [Clostridia bacterium]
MAGQERAEGKRRSRRWLWALIPTAVIAADQVTKAFAVRLTEPLSLIPGLLTLRYTLNTGISFGWLDGNGFALGFLSIALLALGYLAVRRFRLGGVSRTGALLILGGGLSNAADRLLRGVVVDMIQAVSEQFAVFNVADMAVCIGAGLITLSLLLFPDDWQMKEKNGKDE